MDTSPGFSCLEANTDISGIGVRIAFYIQTIACVLLAARSVGEAPNSVWTLLGTSFGLTMSAVVTAAQHALPLYQGIIVTYLVWLSNFSVLMALATYARHPKPSQAVKIAAIAQTYFSMAWTLYLWARAASFGPNTAIADQTIFVILFFHTPAVGTGRVVALTVTAILIILYTLLVYSMLGRQQRPIEQVENAAQDCNLDASHRRDPRLPLLPADPYLLVLIGIFGFPYIITVVCTELQIARNRLCSSNSSWGFGQILAMTVTAVPMFTMIHAFWRHGWRQRMTRMSISRLGGTE